MDRFGITKERKHRLEFLEGRLVGYGKMSSLFAVSKSCWWLHVFMSGPGM